MKEIYDCYVHEFVDGAGVVRYAVAKLVNGQYICPLDAGERKLTGCSAKYGSLKTLGGYLTKRQALRRARYLFS